MTLLSFQRVAALVFAAALSIEICSAQSPATNQTVVLTQSGKVEVAFVGSTVWTPTHTNEALKVGDRLRTGKSSRATLKLSNQSILRVYELTTLEIQAPQAGRKTALNLQSGAAYFFDRDKPLETQFRTPSASGAIRGTEFNLAVDANGRTELAVIDGEVGLTNAQGSLDAVSGEKAVVDRIGWGRRQRKSPMIDAVNIIQWTLYYPGVLDADELALDDAAKSALAPSLEAYRGGDLLQALALYPEGRAAAADAERVYRAALLLAVGQVDEAQSLLNTAAQSPLAAGVAGDDCVSQGAAVGARGATGFGHRMAGRIVCGAGAPGTFRWRCKWRKRRRQGRRNLVSRWNDWRKWNSALGTPTGRRRR